MFNIKFDILSPYSATCGRYALPISSSVASGSCSTVLPVGLLSFNAAVANSIVNLEWTTTNEKNVAHYLIQKSSNGIDFYLIGKITSANNPAVHYYSFTDQNPVAGKNYYRLVVVDTDGSSEISEIEVIESSAAYDFTITPNPSNGKFTLSATVNGSATINIKMVNLIGQTILQFQDETSEVTYQKELYLTYLPKGVYNLFINSGYEQSVKRIIIE